MPRLRTTTAWSLLALLLGILGTQWLSERTAHWQGPRPAAGAAPSPRHSPSRPGRPHAMALRRARPAATPILATMPATAATAALVPLDAPAPDVPYAALRGHLDGSVAIAVTLDATGAVASATLDRSSGDAVLDAYALASVRGWRFAAPRDGGARRGTLTIRFTGADADGLARGP
ncbi:MAG: energy transducer TonB [Sinobacteraceae bacterium]|nr:energy transducer TonB [Nevskiaceae bacterium]